MTQFLIGIDDTDNAESPGTGQLARRVCNELVRWGGVAQGITRHQFLIDPRIPYTGHNRGICIAIGWEGPVEELSFVYELVAGWSAEGSDPGVCMAHAGEVAPEVIAWGEAAMTDVLTMDGAVSLAARAGLPLKALGGTGQGIVGALGSVGLRAGGKHGRFVEMPGLRELGEHVSAEKLAAMGIEVEHREPLLAAGARALAKNGIYKTLGWVRPRLHNGKAVLAVEWSDEHDDWVPVDRKKEHALE